MQLPFLNQHKIPHKIVNANTKRLTLKFNRDGILVVRKPYVMPIDKVEKFIELHINWILKHFETAQPIKRKYESGEEYLYLGKKYLLNVVGNKYQQVYINDNVIYVFVPHNKTAEQVLEAWRKEEAEKVFSVILHSCFDKMRLHLKQFPLLEIKHYKARWGTCYPRKNKISINLSLIHVEIDLIEYVIYHELVHFIHADHSKEYHDFLKRFVPDEFKRRSRLKKYKCDYK